MKCCYLHCRNAVVVLAEDYGIGIRAGYCEEHSHLLFGRPVSFEVTGGEISCNTCGASKLGSLLALLKVSAVQCPQCGNLVPDACSLGLRPVRTLSLPDSVVLETRQVPVLITPDFVVVATSLRIGDIDPIRFRLNRDTYTVFLDDPDLAQLLQQYQELIPQPDL